MAIQNDNTKKAGRKRDREYPCRARQKTTYQERRAAGICTKGCGHPAVKHGMCDEHMAMRLSYPRPLYDKGMSPNQTRRVNDGLCRICDTPRGESGTTMYCAFHAQEMIARDDR